MKRKSLLIAFTALFFLLMAAGDVYTFTNGAPAARSGGAGESTCATSSCHTGTVNSGSGTVTLTSDAPGNIYTPGMTYTITVEVAQSGISRFGFQVLSGYNAGVDASVGTTTVTNASETKLVSGGNRRYVTQLTAGSTGSNTRTWSFDWTAPNQGVGDVEFFASGNAANNNGNRTGDQIYTTSLLLSEAPVSVEEALDPLTIQLAPSIVQDQLNLKLTGLGLDQVQLFVIDASGRVVSEEAVQPIGTEMRRSFNTRNYAPGVYYLRVVGNDIAEVAKFVKF